MQRLSTTGVVRPLAMVARVFDQLQAAGFGKRKGGFGGSSSC